MERRFYRGTLYEFTDPKRFAPLSKSIRLAALWAIQLTEPIQQEAEANWRLMRVVLELPERVPITVELETHFRELRARGAIGWDPKEEILEATWTPTVQDFSADHGKNRFLSRTVVFSNHFAHALVIASMECIKVHGEQGHDWDLRNMTIFTLNEDGDGYDRPFYICPNRNLAMLA